MLKKKISFQVSHLNSLLDSENSCVSLHKNFRGKLTLLPFHLGYLKHAVKELLDNKVSKYDPELNGIILGHSNIKVINSLKHSDSGVINLSYIADIYLFTPVVGKILTGVVNKKSKEHIGCLIHSAFNASIPKPRSVGEDLSLWLRKHGSLQIGNELDFTVSKVDFTSRVPYISGIILKNESHNEEEVDSGVCCFDSVDEDSKKTVKKKRKSKSDSNSEIVVFKKESDDETCFHDPGRITELFNLDSKLVKGKRKKDDNDYGSSPSQPIKKRKKNRPSLERDESEIPSNPNDSPIKLNVKKGRLSLTPEVVIPSSSKVKSKRNSFEGDSTSKTKIKNETDVDELASCYLREAMEKFCSPKGNGSEKKKKKKKSSDDSSSGDSIIKGNKRKRSNVPEVENAEISEEKISKKRKRSESPLKLESEDSFTKKSKKRRLKESIDLEEMTNSILAETMSKIK